MKTGRFFSIIKASALHNKGRSISFCIFIIICTLLVTTVISVFVPMQRNMEEKINNHILNRETIIHFDPNRLESQLEKAKKLDHLSYIYRRPITEGVLENSGILFDSYELSYIHKGDSPIITAGRKFKESEKNVAVIPETIQDYNNDERRSNTIDGKELIGKALTLIDGYGGKHTVKVVGTYNTVDPMYTGKQILIPMPQLLKINEKNKEAVQTEHFDDNKETVDYVLTADSYRNLSSLEAAANDIALTYTENWLSFNKDTFNTALIIIMGGGVLLILMSFSGAVTFISGSLKSRQRELALYRSFGYKSIHIFRIIFMEFLILCIPSVIIGTAACLLANLIIINPYLYSIMGNTIMEIKAEVNMLYPLGIGGIFIFILIIVCFWAARKSEKTDLMILLRET